MVTKKEQIIIHYEYSINWVKSLSKLSEEQWRTPIKKDKWSVAEVIGHLIPWDEFVLNQRIPYFFTEINMPKGPDATEVNNQASVDSKIRSKEQIIENFIVVRKKLINALNNLDEELWLGEFFIGTSKLSLCTYFSGLSEHDEHHFMQIRNGVQWF